MKTSKYMIDSRNHYGTTHTDWGMILVMVIFATGWIIAIVH